MKEKFDNLVDCIFKLEMAGIGAGLMCFGYAIIKVTILDDFLKAFE